MNSIFIIAHSPLAQALRQCALHVFPDSEASIVALDVLPNVSPDETLAAARIMLAQLQLAPRSPICWCCSPGVGSQPRSRST